MKETNKNTISVILPIHELKTDANVELFKNAVTSVVNQEVKPDEFIIVIPRGSNIDKEQEEYLKTVDIETRFIINEGGTDFASQVNYGITNAKSEWISILEFDDEYSSKWFKNVHIYMEAHDDVEIFLPLIIDTNDKQEFIGLTNEAAWANSFSDELGFLDNGALLNYQNFNIDGVVMKKELFKTFGGLKSNIKLTFIYEFLLRMTFNDVRTMVIPKYGYKHMNQRPGSLFNQYKNDMNPVESNWWLAQAKKEYYFNSEREITHSETQ